MENVQIETPAEFMEQQERAWQEKEFQKERQLLPTNAQLLKILEAWEGKICFEILSQQQPLIVEMVKSDFLGEMKRNWKGEDKSPFSISVCSYRANVLVLTLF